MDRTDLYEVTQKCIDGAKKLDLKLAALEQLVIDPPRDNELCVCPKYHPELWSPRPAP